MEAEDEMGDRVKERLRHEIHTHTQKDRQTEDETYRGRERHRKKEVRDIRDNRGRLEI